MERYVDEAIGRTTLNSSMRDEKVVCEGVFQARTVADVNTRFPIPNKREIRKGKSEDRSTSNTTNLRKIIFKGD
ncbi:conserved hypothetical protein [Ricinus communis]|uniref:Uncharacterized protein n=1 Tax=Ricinus communis TaxID=3988 RepID=B9RT60_RICCO|nr:conserved hypothetical protein [Ricinus communis]